MSTTTRHNRIVGALNGSLFPFVKKKEMHVFTENISLVHYGRMGKGDELKLTDIKKVKDLDLFTSETIHYLEYKQPDFICFYENKFVMNERETKIAGCPDLVVEVWSPYNDAEDRAAKLELYSSSPLTEFWTIEHDSNTIECYSKGKLFKTQDISSLVYTQKGLEFDLRHLV
jgi:Uma2 family endonuclease